MLHVYASRTHRTDTARHMNADCENRVRDEAEEASKRYVASKGTTHKACTAA